MNRFCIAAVFTAAAMVAVGCQNAKPPAPPPTTAPGMQVMIDNFSFSPAELTVHVGDNVVWTNHDDVPHTVVSKKPDRTLHSDALDTDDKYEHRFTDAGTYDYFCSVHTHMTGKIIVLPAERK